MRTIVVCDCELSEAVMWCDVSWLTVRQLPESRGQMAEVFVVEGRLGWEPVLWEALEKSGSQLFSMIYITQPANTHRYKHTDDYSAKITTHTRSLLASPAQSLCQLHSRWRAAGRMFVDFFGVENAKASFHPQMSSKLQRQRPTQTHPQILHCSTDKHTNTQQILRSWALSERHMCCGQ